MQTMNEIIKKDLASTIASAIGIIKLKEQKDILELKELSNHIIHNASIFQDEDSVSLAILIYSLSKTIERNFSAVNYAAILNMLENCLEYISSDNEAEYRKTIKKLFSQISDLDSELKIYVQEVINQAQIKKGSLLYKHGISLARAAEVLGISQWELMGYVGHTMLTDMPDEGIDIESRLKFTRRLFS